MNYREEFLKQVEGIICTGDRYGKPENSFKLISKLWSAYLGIEVKEQDVCMLMALLKIARVKAFPEHIDSLLDLIGYTVCCAENLNKNTKENVDWEAN